LRFDGDPNFRSHRETQYLKHDSPTNVSDAGREIVVMAEQLRNANVSIRAICESGGNCNRSSLAHPEKAHWQMVFTDAGRTTD
jgi:hypothetical protein